MEIEPEDISYMLQLLVEIRDLLQQIKENTDWIERH